MLLQLKVLDGQVDYQFGNMEIKIQITFQSFGVIQLQLVLILKQLLLRLSYPFLLALILVQLVVHQLVHLLIQIVSQLLLLKLVDLLLELDVELVIVVAQMDIVEVVESTQMTLGVEVDVKLVGLLTSSLLSKGRDFFFFFFLKLSFDSAY